MCGLFIFLFEVVAGVALILWLTRNERKLTRAQRYLERRADELNFDSVVREIDHEEEIRDLKKAIHLLWYLSWRV